MGLDVPEVIRKARIDSGMTAAQFADKAGTSRAAIHAYETGVRAPGIHALERILAAAGKRLEVVSHAGMDRMAAGTDPMLEQ